MPNPVETDETEPILPQSTISTRKKSILIALIATIIFAFVAAALYLLLNGSHGDPVLTYPGETISWAQCGDLEGKPVECCTIDVPMDHFNASRSGNKTFSIPMMRLRGNANATHSILLNPGGPGGSGVEFLRKRGLSLQKALGDGFHLVGFDPRGIGASRPQAGCFADAKMRRTHGLRLKGDGEQDVQYYEEAGNILQACADHLGEYAPHINTPQTATDMNSVLDALGQDSLYYLGYSYGTLLGATYAMMFPDRVGRVVIDGVVDPFIWYQNLTVERFSLDTDKTVDGFFDECAKAGRNCSLSSFGATGRQIQSNVTHFLDSLRENGPMGVYVNSTTFGTISRDSILQNGIFGATYSSKLWYTLADNLAQLLSGNATAAVLAYPERTSDDGEDVETENVHIIHANDGQSGRPPWPSDRRGVLDIGAAAGKVYAPWTLSMTEWAILRAQWPVPKAHSFEPRRGVETRHPLLVMSSTYDPVCPLAAAHIAREAFVAAKLVEVKGYGHCALSRPSKCANDLLRAYFVSGSLPDEDHVRCGSDEPYFIAPEKEKPQTEQAAGVESAAVEEDEELLAALRDLSGSVPGPRFNW